MTNADKKERLLKCVCGKLIAIERDGRIFVMCKRCKREVEVKRAESQ